MTIFGDYELIMLAMPLFYEPVQLFEIVSHCSNKRYQISPWNEHRTELTYNHSKQISRKRVKGF